MQIHFGKTLVCKCPAGVYCDYRLTLGGKVAIERSRLQKEIWEDEGGIAGRSLDMFISKLRKNWNLIQTSGLLLYVAKVISLKLALKKNPPPQTDV